MTTTWLCGTALQFTCSTYISIICTHVRRKEEVTQCVFSGWWPKSWTHLDLTRVCPKKRVCFDSESGYWIHIHGFVSYNQIIPWCISPQNGLCNVMKTWGWKWNEMGAPVCTPKDDSISLRCCTCISNPVSFHRDFVLKLFGSHLIWSGLQAWDAEATRTSFLLQICQCE